MAEIMALPPKKRMKWKAHLKDKFGVNTRCIYKDGNTWNWSLIVHRWALVSPFSALQLEDSFTYMPISVVGDTISSGADDETINTAIQQEVSTNHTGNHTRNKSVKVPRCSRWSRDWLYVVTTLSLYPHLVYLTLDF
jgi:hypothetical protein